MLEFQKEVNITGNIFITCWGMSVEMVCAGQCLFFGSETVPASTVACKVQMVCMHSCATYVHCSLRPGSAGRFI